MPSPIRDRSAVDRFVVAWFVMDVAVALAPPLYWAADGQTIPIVSVPATLFYFLAVGSCITASVVFAAFIDGLKGNFD